MNSTMDYTSTLRAVRGLKVQTGSLACLGCGYEHGCSVHGCAILRSAVEHMEAALANYDHLSALVEEQDKAIREYEMAEYFRRCEKEADVSEPDISGKKGMSEDGK